MILYSSSAGLQTTAPPAQEWTENDTGLHGATTGDSFGASLASGDFDADGHADLAIGAPLADVSPTKFDAGMVFVLPGSGTGLQQTSPPAQQWSQDTPGVDDKSEAKDHFGGYLIVATRKA